MEFRDRTFEDVRIELDANQYVNCTFKRCRIVYSGAGPFSLDGCTFDDVRWQFSGRAANTLAFMQGMYHGSGLGGRKLIEDIFNQIRFGELTQVGQNPVPAEG